MNESSNILVIGMALLVLMIAGCAPRPTRLESMYGASYGAAIASQILHPETATHLVQVEEFDGKSARHVVDRYRSTFEKPLPPPSFAISVGGIK